MRPWHERYARIGSTSRLPLRPPLPPIALDATYSVGAALSGVGVYSREILQGLARLAPEQQQFRWCYRPHRLGRSLRETLPPRCSRRILWEQWPPVSCSLFHGLNQRLPRWRARRMVVTFHDLFVLTGEYSTPEFRSRFTLQAREAVERADVVICVSAYTAAQVEALLGVERSRLRVVWHGVHPLTQAPPTDGERENLVLHVGAIQKRKNLPVLINAFERLDATWRLILAGSQGYGAEETLERIARSPARERIELTGWVDDQQLEQLYQRARIFAFPSLDEGFGIPVLEAMARGIPVITSDRAALREVAGTAAAVVDVTGDGEQLATALERLVADGGERRLMREKGLAHASRHSWEAAAAQTWEVYQELW